MFKMIKNLKSYKKNREVRSFFKSINKFSRLESRLFLSIIYLSVFFDVANHNLNKKTHSVFMILFVNLRLLRSLIICYLYGTPG